MCIRVGASGREISDNGISVDVNFCCIEVRRHFIMFDVMIGGVVIVVM